MARWISNWGEEFDNEADARMIAAERMDWDDYKNELMCSISFDELIDWAKNAIGFEERFGEQLAEAENQFFLDNYQRDDYDAEDLGYDI